VQGLHVLGCFMVSAAHGSNDGQLIVGLLALAEAAASSRVDTAAAPAMLRLLAAGVFATGVLMGGRRLLRKIGLKFYRIRDMQGLGAQSAAAITMMGCLASGFPASTTQLVSGSIVGAGVAKNVRSVRWAVVGEIVLSWVVTIPATAALSALFALAMRSV
jgi:inorganic phosphate transporter, PiT family